MLAGKAVAMGFVLSILPNTMHQFLKNKNRNEGASSLVFYSPSWLGKRTGSFLSRRIH